MKIGTRSAQLKRKVLMALRPMPFEKVTVNCTGFDFVEKTHHIYVRFRYQGIWMSTDFAGKVGEPLPKVADIRQEVWKRVNAGMNNTPTPILGIVHV